MLKNKKKPKKPSISLLKKKADKAFSLAIRLRDSDKNGYGECITCGKVIHYKQAHAGHFMSRRYNSTRYDQLNVNLQCPMCNNWGAGEQYRYGKALDQKYGAETADTLMKKAQEFHKLTVEELNEIIHDAKVEVEFYGKANIIK